MQEITRTKMPSKENLISKSYKKANQQLHNSTNYGYVNQYIENKTAAVVSALIKAKFCNSVLDYGCGRGSLVQLLKQKFADKIQIQGYDPGTVEFDNAYIPADIVTSFDVLEHIEYSKIDEVLNDISNHTTKFFICIIDLLPAQKKLPDGRNAHILLAPPGWWMERLSDRFELGHYYIHSSGPLNRKLCFVGTKNNELASIGSQIFTNTFF